MRVKSGTIALRIFFRNGSNSKSRTRFSIAAHYDQNSVVENARAREPSRSLPECRTRWSVSDDDLLHRRQRLRRSPVTPSEPCNSSAWPIAVVSKSKKAEARKGRIKK